MVEAKSFDCPNCGSSLDYSGGSEDIIQCQYCGSSVIPPEEAKMAVSQFPEGGTQFTGNPQELAKLAELGVLVADGSKIEAVKKYREIFAVGLKEAKEAVDKMMRGESVTVTHTSTSVKSSSPTTAGWTFPKEENADFSKLKELAVLVKANKKIQAVKLYRELYGVGLKEAKQAVDKMRRGESVTVSRTTTVETSAPITSWTFPGKGTAGYSKFKEFTEMVKANKSKEAARLYRDMYDVSVYEANEAVNKVATATASVSRPSKGFFSCLTALAIILFLTLLTIFLINNFFPNNPIAPIIDTFIP
jgi:ribosomal protein L7/L12